MRQVPDKPLARRGRLPSDMDGDMPDDEYRATVSLHCNQTRIQCSEAERDKAIEAAYRVTMSTHEHEWTREEQQAMAQFCLWAHQRLSAVRQVAGGKLDHAS